MRRGLRAWLCAVVVLAAACGAAPDSPPPARVAPRARQGHLTFGAPIYRAADDGQTFRPLITYLERRLAVRIELQMAEPYRALPALLKEGKVDLALLPPLAYVRARDDEPRILPVASVVVAGSPTYLGHLYVKADSRFHSLADVQGARVGYVDSESTSGYLFPRDLLRYKGYDPDTFFASTVFLHSHPAVLDAVAKGDVDVGAAEDMTTDWLGEHSRPEGLRVIAKTERIPNDCLAARPGFDAPTSQAILQALLELRPGLPQAASIAASMGINGWIPADEARYDRVRRVLDHEKMSTHSSPVDAGK